MSITVPSNMAEVSGQACFKDTKGRFTYVSKADLTEENMELLSNPTALAVFKEGLNDFYDGRFDDFDDFEL